MAKPTTYNWAALIAEQEASGLSVAVFFKVVVTIYSKFVRPRSFVHFLCFPCLGLMKQSLPAGNF